MASRALMRALRHTGQRTPTRPLAPFRLFVSPCLPGASHIPGSVASFGPWNTMQDAARAAAGVSRSVACSPPDEARGTALARLDVIWTRSIGQSAPFDSARLGVCGAGAAWERGAQRRGLAKSASQGKYKKTRGKGVPDALNGVVEGFAGLPIGVETEVFRLAASLAALELNCAGRAGPVGGPRVRPTPVNQAPRTFWPGS
jgi:hypothetical protein